MFIVVQWYVAHEGIKDQCVAVMFSSVILLGGGVRCLMFNAVQQCLRVHCVAVILSNVLLKVHRGVIVLEVFTVSCTWPSFSGIILFGW